MVAFFFLFHGVGGRCLTVDPLHSQIETSQGGRWRSCHWPSALVALWLCKSQGQIAQLQFRSPPCPNQKPPPSPLLLILANVLGVLLCVACASPRCHSPSSDQGPHAVPCPGLVQGPSLQGAGEMFLLSWFRSFHRWCPAPAEQNPRT